MSLMICSLSASLRLTSSELRTAAAAPSAPGNRFLRSRNKFPWQPRKYSELSIRD